ncbi:MAG: reverse transcriptase family protein [Candidatus Thorarchaeota archaeon]
MIQHKIERNKVPLILEPNDLQVLFNFDYVKLEKLLTIKNEVSPKEFLYRSYKLKKKGEGYRQIVAPKKDLKRVQNIIFTRILELIEPSEFAHGFRKEYSIVSNARVHLNSEIIYTIDLKNFFTSIKFDKVQEVFQRLGYSESVSLLLARLCTITPRYYSKQKNLWILYKDRLPYLPQGASTSPILSNLVCIELDKGLNEIATRFNFRFTRYADDITFSSKIHKKIPKDFQNEVFQCIRKGGFKVNWKKERYSRNFKKEKSQESLFIKMN